MTVTTPLDHLQTLNLLAKTLPAATAATATAATTTAVTPALPSSVTTTHYAPDGQTVAATSVTSYAGVTVGADGKPTGGQITHTTKSAAGVPLDQSIISLTAAGTPGQIRTTVQNRFAPGAFKIVEADLSATHWTPTNAIGGGIVALTTRDAATGAVRSEAQLQFANEGLQRAVFAHRAWAAGDGKVDHYTEVDYTTAKTVGMRMVGGTCGVTFKNAAQGVVSRSTMALSEHGTVSKVDTQTFDPASGSWKAQVTSDFSTAAFDGTGKLHSGTVNITVSGADGIPRSAAAATFANGIPQTTRVQTFDGGKPSLTSVTDYTVNRLEIGTPDRHGKGTPCSG